MNTPSDAQPPQYDLTIVRGETWQRVFAWTTGVPAMPVDLTGWTARMQIRQDWLAPGLPSGSALVSLTTENGAITLGGAAGTVEAIIDATTTSSLVIDDGVYDLELISPSGRVTKLLRGDVRVLPEATV